MGVSSPKPQRFPLLKSVAFAFCAGVLGLAVGLFAVEAFLRTSNPINRIASRRLRPLPGAEGAYVYREATPSPDGGRQDPGINNLGFRFVRRPDADVTWVCLGDSFTFGLGVRDDQSWPSLLQRKADMAAQQTVEVANLGLPGAGMSTYRRLGAWAARELEPDLVILSLFVPSDFVGDVYDRYHLDHGKLAWLGSVGLRQVRHRVISYLETRRQEQVRADRLADDDLNPTYPSSGVDLRNDGVCDCRCSYQI